MQQPMKPAEQLQPAPTRQQWTRGLKDGLPIAVGYIPIAIAFGLLAKSAGLPGLAVVLMSVLVYAGASQFAGVNLIAAGAAVGEIVMTAFIINLRHFLLTASLSRRMDEPSKWRRALIAFSVTDETFSVASLKNHGGLHKSYLLGIQIIAYLSWNLGTLLGIGLGSILNESLKASMGIALYAMFIALLVPAMSKSFACFTVAAMSMTVHSILYWVPWFAPVSPGWKLLISALAAAAVGAWLFPGTKEAPK